MPRGCGLAGVDTDADPHLTAGRPGMTGERLLRFETAGDRFGGVRENAKTASPSVSTSTPP